MNRHYLLAFAFIVSNVSTISADYDYFSAGNSTVSPEIKFNFLAFSAANCRGTSIGTPENPTIGVGPRQAIVLTTQNLKSFDKFTGQFDGVLDVDAAPFAAAGGTAKDPFLFDPYLLYDRFAKIWFVSGENGASQNALQYIVSNEPVITPATKWFSYKISAKTINPIGNGQLTDYEQPAVDQNAWYNGVGCFDHAGTFVGSTLAVVSKSSILAGKPKPTLFPGLFPEILNLVKEGFAAPASNYDHSPKFGYFLWTIYDAPDFIEGQRVQLYRVRDAGSDKPLLGPLVTIDLPEKFAFNQPFVPHKGNVMGAPGLLQPQLALSAPLVRNKQLYFAHLVQCDSNGHASITGDRTAIRWYQFDLTGDSTGRGLGVETPATVPVLIQSGTLFDNAAVNPLFYNMASIMVNKNGDLILGFNTSGIDAYINAAFAFRAASDPLGTLRAPVYVTNTHFPCNYGANTTLNPGPNCQRWGDEATAAIDPSNDLDFWLVQPYAAVQNGWGMRVYSVIPPKL